MFFIFPLLFTSFPLSRSFFGVSSETIACVQPNPKTKSKIVWNVIDAWEREKNNHNHESDIESKAFEIRKKVNIMAWHTNKLSKTEINSYFGQTRTNMKKLRSKLKPPTKWCFGSFFSSLVFLCSNTQIWSVCSENRKWNGTKINERLTKITRQWTEFNHKFNLY